MRGVLPVIMIVVLAVLAGCGDAPTKEPATADLVGIYRPTPETTDLVTKEGGYPSRAALIQLKADGSFEFQDVPDWWRDVNGKPGKGFDNGSGTWKTIQEDGRWQMELQFPDMKRFSSPHIEGSFSAHIFLIGQKAPYLLKLTIGDPDDGKALIFAQDSIK
jgi:hypothetical protein